MLLLIIFIPESFSRSVFALIRGSWLDFRQVIGGYAMLAKNMPAILSNAMCMRRRNGIVDE